MLHKYYERYKSPEIYVGGMLEKRPCFINSIPHTIDYDSENYYFVNWNHNYIGLDIHIEIDYSLNRIWLFDHDCKPWDDQEYMDKYIRKFHNALKTLELKGVINRKPPNLILPIEL